MKFKFFASFAASREQLVKMIDRRDNEKMKSAAARVSICWRAAVVFWGWHWITHCLLRSWPRS